MKITLEESLPFVRWLETQLIPRHAHCALGGSVLHRGWSEKDLDVIVYPHNQRTPKTPEELIDVLQSIFPTGKMETDTGYPHDRYLFRVNGWGDNKWRLELFVFLTEQL
jgi:hypothetical protein